jgi:hypothetical protein
MLLFSGQAPLRQIAAIEMCLGSFRGERIGAIRLNYILRTRRI